MCNLGGLSHHQDIPKNHKARHGTFFFIRITFSSHVHIDPVFQKKLTVNQIPKKDSRQTVFQSSSSFQMHIPQFLKYSAISEKRHSLHIYMFFIHHNFLSVHNSWKKNTISEKRHFLRKRVSLKK